MLKRILSSLAVLTTVGFVPAFAAVDFSSVSISEPVTVAELEGALGLSGTDRIDGVALAPGGQIFVSHRAPSTFTETFALISPLADPFNATSVAFTRTNAQITAALGISDYIPDDSEFTFSADTSKLYAVDKSETDPRIFTVDLNSPYTISSVIQDAALGEATSMGVLPSGTVVVATGGALGKVVGGVYTELFSAADFEAAYIAQSGSPTAELAPEALGVHPVTGDVYLFCHDDLQLFRITNVDTTPVATWLNIAGWSGTVDFHGLSVDEDGNVYGFDEASEGVLVWNGTNTFAVEFDSITTALGNDPMVTPFEATVWRGLKARKINADQSEVWLASSNAEYGIVRILFGGTLSVDNWSAYH